MGLDLSLPSLHFLSSNHCLAIKLYFSTISLLARTYFGGFDQDLSITWLWIFVLNLFDHDFISQDAQFAYLVKLKIYQSLVCNSFSFMEAYECAHFDLVLPDLYCLWLRLSFSIGSPSQKVYSIVFWPSKPSKSLIVSIAANDEQV